MAQTFTYGDLLNLIGRQVGRNIEDSFAPIIANLATNQIWHRYDWRESLAELPPFWLTPNEQDFGPPVFAVPTNFMSLRQAYCVDMQSTPPTRWELQVIRDLRLTQVKSFPSAISYEPTKQAFRVFPRTPENFAAPNYLIDGTYKKRPTKITPAILASTALPFDDFYLQTWIEVGKWAAWSLAGDQRAVQQIPVAEMFIDQMAKDEGVYLGDPSIAPQEALALTSWGFSGGIGRLIR